MSSSQYNPLSGRTRLIAAETSGVLTFSIFAAVASGLTGGDATRHGATALPAASAVPHPA